MITINNLKITLGNNEIIKDVNLEINTGEFITIYGPNGSGKSTIIKALADINKYEGKVLYNGQDIKEFDKKIKAQQFAFLMQSGDEAPTMSVYDYVSFGRTPYRSIFDKPTLEDYKIIDKVIESLELENYKERHLATLSGGEKQRVYLAMCLAQQPEVLVLDEITNHLDIKHQVELLELVKKINTEQNVTVITILHDINLSLKYADKIFFLDKGIIQYTHVKGEPINQDIIGKIFGMEIKVVKADEVEYISYF